MIGYLRFEEKKILINSFIYGNFNYCPLAWHFCSKNSLNKIENIQKRALRFLLNDNESDYKTLLKKCNKCTMEVRSLKHNNLNPAFMKNLFAKWEVSKRKNSNLEISKRNTVKYGDKSIRSHGPHIWNGLTEEIKNENSYNKFKEYLNTWYGPKCTCNLCSFNEINT